MLLTSRQRSQLFSQLATLEHAGIAPAQAFAVVGRDLPSAARQALAQTAADLAKGADLAKAGWNSSVLRAVGSSPTHHNLYPLQARLIKGAPLRVVAERVAMAGHRLRWLVSRIDQSRPYYLLGEVEIPDGRGPAMTGRLDSVETYNPASYRGGILRLHYARAAELGPWLDLVAVRGEVVVQFWLKPGETAVTLGPGEEREVERIPKQLRRFL